MTDAPPAPPPPPLVRLVGRGEARPFSRTALDRFRRGFGRAGVVDVAEAADGLPATGRLVLVRADHVFDDALMGPLAAGEDLALATDGGAPAAIATDARHAAAAVALLESGTLDPAAAAALGLRIVRPAELAGAYRKNLRNVVPPYVLSTRDMPVAAIERHMFMASYKGLTDFVTKYVFPSPALVVVRWCAALGISPNAVTFVSFLCVVAATILFWYGWFLSGLAFAWAMCFLDTVDGKLARVTLTSSKWGNVFDHGTDLVHPPFWWFAWYWGVATTPEFAGTPYMQTAMWIVLAGYIVGRLEEGVFLWGFRFEMFTWRPIDAFSRLITARRNPNLVLFLAFTLAGRPDLGLAAVAAWTVLCLSFHAVRIAQAFVARAMGRPVASYQTAGAA